MQKITFIYRALNREESLPGQNHKNAAQYLNYEIHFRLYRLIPTFGTSGGSSCG